MAYRHGAVFVRDLREHSTPLDRNTKSKILYLAEALERRTKRKGQRIGCLGHVGLAVLRAMLQAFHNRDTGLCFPGYGADPARHRPMPRFDRRRRQEARSCRRHHCDPPPSAPGCDTRSTRRATSDGHGHAARHEYLCLQARDSVHAT